MAGKSGGNKAILAASLQQQAQAAEAKAAEQARNQAAELRLQQQSEADKAERAARVVSSGNRVSDAYSAARTNGLNKLGARGIDINDDKYGIMSMFDASLNKAKAGVPDIVDNPSSLFADTAIDDILSEVRTTQRGKLASNVGNDFGSDYGLRTFSDTADDNIIESILSKQKTEANENLDRALARGTINESGRAKSNDALNDMYTKGKATANSIGGNVLSGFRSQLEDGVSRVRDNAANWDFNNNFDYDKEKAGIDTLRGSLSGKLEGDILSAIGDTSFFDNDILLGKGGNATGITNAAGPAVTPTLSNPLVGSADRTKGTSGTGRQLTSADEVF